MSISASTTVEESSTFSSLLVATLDFAISSVQLESPCGMGDTLSSDSDTLALFEILQDAHTGICRLFLNIGRFGH